MPLRYTYLYTHKKNKFVSYDSCLQTYYTRGTVLCLVQSARHENRPRSDKEAVPGLTNEAFPVWQRNVPRLA